MAHQIIGATLLLIVLFLVLSNANDFATASKAVTGLYTESVRTLQGR